MLAMNNENLVILSVSEISAAIKNTVEKGFSNIKVKGEISGFKIHSSGHAYFAIKDKDCVLDAVMWRGTKVSTPIQDGLEIIATGKITTYGARSKYQMIVTSLENAGEGALLKILQEKKIQFQKEGLFDRKKPIPKFPKTIGVITSPTGAVIKDILHRIEDRFPCNIILWPVLVQGIGSKEQIETAIKGFNNLDNKPDLLIVARGGGSLEDLWSFNEEIVIRAVASSSIPIISAIGHETDFTLIDFAADMRAPTPTAAAEIATPDRQNLKILIKEIDAKINRSFKQIFEICYLNLKSLIKSIPDLPSVILEKSQKLDDWNEKLVYFTSNILKYKKNDLEKNKIPSLSQRIEKSENDFSNTFNGFKNSIKNYLEKKEQSINWNGMILNQNSYHRTLEKGFCLLTVNESVISSAKSINKQTKAQLTFHDGKINVVSC